MTRRVTDFAFAMKHAGLNQKTLATLAGCHRCTVGRWMHGKAQIPDYAWTIVRLHKRVTELSAATTPTGEP